MAIATNYDKRPPYVGYVILLITVASVLWACFSHVKGY